MIPNCIRVEASAKCCSCFLSPIPMLPGIVQQITQNKFGNALANLSAFHCDRSSSIFPYFVCLLSLCSVCVQSGRRHKPSSDRRGINVSQPQQNTLYLAMHKAAKYTGQYSSALVSTWVGRCTQADRSKRVAESHYLYVSFEICVSRCRCYRSLSAKL